MNFSNKKRALETAINDSLIPLINDDYVLWDLPYHDNVGDILIWEGERQFLHKLSYKCLNSSSLYTCAFPKLRPSTIILLHGGGNFGDIWREHQDFRLKVIETYPDNRIIVFPQTVYYEEMDRMYQDVDKMKMHKDLILCARDLLSYNFLNKNFKNKILLLPDMAFCIGNEIISQWRKKEENRILLIKRLDKEADNEVNLDSLLLEECLEVHDWPSIEKNSWNIHVLKKIVRLQSILHKKGIRKRGIMFLVDKIVENVYRPLLLKQGIGFVSVYKSVYTTRLHVMILSILLQKKVIFIDNVYGKNSSFYNTWLNDLNGVEPYL